MYMKYVLPTLVVAAVIFAGGYWYQIANSICPIPLSYAIGSIDARFDLSEEEARLILSEVESGWEDATGQNLFTYDDDAAFTVNFVYDERQRQTDEELALKHVLDRKEDVSSAIREEYDELLGEYEDLRDRYEERVAAYENALSVHNGEVAHWNAAGGAPPAEYERLNAEQARLGEENAELRQIAKAINGLVDRLNELGEAGNETVRDYNSNVAAYNDRFHHEREFTQGDYRQGRINIYQFKDEAELKLVLAHELGHALSLDHVEGEASIMHYLMGGQESTLRFSETDLAEFARVCGKR